MYRNTNKSFQLDFKWILKSFLIFLSIKEQLKSARDYYLMLQLLHNR